MLKTIIWKCLLLHQPLMRFLNLEGPATAAVWGSFHSAKKHCEMIEQPSVEIYPLGNHQADDYEMKVWIPIKEEV